MAATRPQYVPSSEEMKDAVAVALKDVSSIIEVILDDDVLSQHFRVPRGALFVPIPT